MLQTMRLKLFFAIHLPLFKKNQTNPNFITRVPQNLTCKNVISSSSVCSKQRSGTFQCFNQIRGIFLRLKRLSLEQSNNRGLEGEAETETLTNIILCNSVVQTCHDFTFFRRKPFSRQRALAAAASEGHAAGGNGRKRAAVLASVG